MVATAVYMRLPVSLFASLRLTRPDAQTSLHPGILFYADDRAPFKKMDVRPRAQPRARLPRLHSQRFDIQCVPRERRGVGAFAYTCRALLRVLVHSLILTRKAMRFVRSSSLTLTRHGCWFAGATARARECPEPDQLRDIAPRSRPAPASNHVLHRTFFRVHHQLCMNSLGLSVCRRDANVILAQVRDGARHICSSDDCSPPPLSGTLALRTRNTPSPSPLLVR
jgi:hypothetical protein